MSIEYLNRAFNCSKLSSLEKLLLIAISDCANDDGFGFPGYKKLMSKTNMAKSTVAKHIKTLVESGVVAIKPHASIGEGRKVNTYQIAKYWLWADLEQKLIDARKTRKVRGLDLSLKSMTLKPNVKSSNLKPRKVRGSNPKSMRVEHEPSVLTISNEPSVKGGCTPKHPNGLNLESWNRYLDHRKALKLKKLQPHSEELQMAALAKLNQGEQIACVNDTCRNGWQGLFPDKYKSNKTAISNQEYEPTLLPTWASEEPC